MTKTKLALLMASALLIPLAGECSAPTADRQGPQGAVPDGYQDMQHVVVYRAPDTVPNVAVFCIGQHGFVATLKAGSSDGGITSPAMLRYPEYDKTCAT